MSRMAAITSLLTSLRYDFRLSPVFRVRCQNQSGFMESTNSKVLCGSLATCGKSHTGSSTSFADPRILCAKFWSGSSTEEILGKPVTMPGGDLYPSIDYWMPHQQLKMLVPVMLLRTACESVTREFRGGLDHFPKIGLFTQPLVRTYVAFDKGPEQ